MTTYITTACQKVQTLCSNTFVFFTMLNKLGPWCWSAWMFQVLIHQGKKIKLCWKLSTSFKYLKPLLSSTNWPNSHGHLQPPSWTHTPKSLVLISNIKMILRIRHFHSKLFNCSHFGTFQNFEVFWDASIC